MTHRPAESFQDRVIALTRSLETLRERLAEEREALRARADADALEAMARAKHAVVEQVSVQYDTLREALAGLGSGPDAGGALGALQASRPELGAHVERLVALIRECQQANQDNGALVNAGLRSASSALDMLAPKPADTYDTHGRTRRDGGADFLALRA